MNSRQITRYVDHLKAKRAESRLTIAVGVVSIVLSPIGLIVSIILAISNGEAAYLLISPSMVFLGLLAVIVGKILDWVYDV